jgi:hypothetical protein
MNNFAEDILSPSEKRDIEECFILGKLAEDRFDLPPLGIDTGKSVSYTDFDDVVFYIQSLSPEPNLLYDRMGKSPHDVFITFANRNRRYSERFNYFDAEDRVNFIREHFKGKLILFKPVLTFEKNRGKWHYNLEIVYVEEGPTEHDYIPIPSLKKGFNHNRLEKLLIDKIPFELPMHTHSMDIPEFIVCEKYLYRIKDPEALEKRQGRNTLYRCVKPEDIKRIPLPDEWYHKMAKAMYKDLSFITVQTKIELIDVFDEHGESIIESYKQQEKKEEKIFYENVSQMKAVPPEKETISESQFIERLRYLADKHGLIYEFNDLINFHTSLKTSRFTILGGMSGTGKSELARLYARALGLKEGDNLLFIPVSPSFTEPSDVLGFLNPQTGIFMESETGLVSFLKKAEREKDKMHMVIFDEMNLGQVEHYFSPFISLLEAPKEERVLRLFSPKSLTHQPELREIKIGTNLLFVGTCNFDETTKDLSNRMLDRSNVILLEKKNFLQARREEEEASKNLQEYQEKIQIDLGDLDQEITTENFLSWIQEERGLRALTDDELIILDQLHEEISNFDSQTGVSFRVAKSIGHYLDNIPKDEHGNHLLSREIAFDYQIKQRILTKIRGHREQIEPLVGRMEDEQTYKDGKLGYILTKENEQFDISRKYLEQKAKELMRNGYTL